MGYVLIAVPRGADSLPPRKAGLPPAARPARPHVARLALPGSSNRGRSVFHSGCTDVRIPRLAPHDGAMRSRGFREKRPALRGIATRVREMLRIPPASPLRPRDSGLSL